MTSDGELEHLKSISHLDALHLEGAKVNDETLAFITAPAAGTSTPQLHEDSVPAQLLAGKTTSEVRPNGYEMSVDVTSCRKEFAELREVI